MKKVVFDRFEPGCVDGFKGEIDLLSRLRDSSRVVKLIDSATIGNTIFMVMERGEVDLAHVLHYKLTGPQAALDVPFVRYHAREIFECVRDVHAHGIVHSDLKPANFLFVKGHLKLIDFGIANAVPEHTVNVYRDSQIGTPNYMAPEALVEVQHTMPFSVRDNAHNTWKVGMPSDVWLCGCIIYQMVYGRPPYGLYRGNGRIQAITDPSVAIDFSPAGLGRQPVPTSLVRLMKLCLHRRPELRPSIAECLLCDFFEPLVVSMDFLRDVVHLAVNFGMQQGSQQQQQQQQGPQHMAQPLLNSLVDGVVAELRKLHYG